MSSAFPFAPDYFIFKSFIWRSDLLQLQKYLRIKDNETSIT